MIYTLQALSLRTRFVVLVLLFFPVLLLQTLLTSVPWALAHLQLISGGAGLPDQRFWYSPDQARALFSAWGEAGRQVYFTVLLPTDFGFLAAYAVFLGAAVLYLMKKLNPPEAAYLAVVLPLGAAAADAAENSLVALALLLPAEGWDAVLWAAALATATKWVLTAATLLLLTGGAALHLGRLGWRRLRGP